MDQNNPYSSESQNAIFNFLFVLIQEYSKTMDHRLAVEKACDWLISLATDVKEKAATAYEEASKLKER